MDATPLLRPHNSSTVEGADDSSICLHARLGLEGNTFLQRLFHNRAFLISSRETRAHLDPGANTTHRDGIFPSVHYRELAGPITLYICIWIPGICKSNPLTVGIQSVRFLKKQVDDHTKLISYL